MKINNFRDDLTDISAKKEALPDTCTPQVLEMFKCLEQLVKDAVPL